MSVSCSQRGVASGPYAFVGVGRRTEHVRSVLLLNDNRTLVASQEYVIRKRTDEVREN